MDKKKILIVDDKALLRDALVDYLGVDNYEFLEADSGEHAMQVLNEKTVNLVILDHNLPGIDGYKTLKLIRKTHPDILIIGLTGELTIEVREEYLREGAFDIHAKSAIYEKLIPTLQAALGGENRPDQLREVQDYLKLAEELGRQGRWEESAMFLKEAGIEQKALGNKAKANELFEEAINRYIRAGRRSKATEIENLIEE